MRKAVEIFAEKMEEKLATKDDARGEDGWLNHATTVKFLLNRLEEEVLEAKEKFDECAPAKLSAECVDIAKFAMMVSDRLRGR